MSRRKLIFFTTADPRTDEDAIFRAYHFANVAATSGLEAEVRLAGRAVDVADIATLPDTERGRDIGQKVRDGSKGAFLVSL
jgi:hypothetical protein